MGTYPRPVWSGDPSNDPTDAELITSVIFTCVYAIIGVYLHAITAPIHSYVTLGTHGHTLDIMV